MQNNTEVNTYVVGNTNTTTHMTLNVIKDVVIPVTKNKQEAVDSSLDCTGKRSRSWFLTINNFTADDVFKIKSEDTIYKVWQYEVGKSGTLHLHCLLYYKNARIWPKKKFPTARIEYPRSLPHSIEYCKKEKTRVEGPWEDGVCPAQGRRKDLEAIADSIKNGASLRDIAETNPGDFIRLHRGLQALKNIYMKPRDPNNKMEVVWLYGNAGLGKTRAVYDEHPLEDIYQKNNTKWWDGYQQQKIIIWDDFSESVPLRTFLTITDRYPTQEEVKGGMVHINSEKLYITCEFPPDEIYGGTDNIKAQVLRRIDIIIHVVDEDTIEVIK